MLFLQYWWRAACRAARATASFYRVDQQSPYFFSVMVIVYVLALLIIRLASGNQQMSEELRWIISIVAAGAVVILPVYLFNLVRAPVQIDALKAKRISVLRSYLQDRRTAHEKETQLGSFVDEGKKLVETILAVDGDDVSPATEASVSDWKERTNQFLLNDVNPTEATRFRANSGRGEPQISHSGIFYSGDKAALANEVEFLSSRILPYVTIHSSLIVLESEDEA